MCLRRLRPFLLPDLLLTDRSLSPSGHDAVRLLAKLRPNLWTLLHHFRFHVHRCVELSGGLDEGTDESDDETVVCSLAVAAYLTTCCQTSELSFFLPVINSHIFALEQILPVVTCLFERSEVPVARKGLHLLNHLLHNLGPGSLCEDWIELLRRYPVHKSLTKVMRFSADADCRMSSVETFKRLVHTFDPIGRVRLMNYLISDPGQHSAIVELLLIQYRNLLVQEPNAPYTGTNLRTVVENSISACFRPTGRSASETPADDLIQNRSECILGLLNFIRFVLLNQALKDCGITDMAANIRIHLIAPLNEELQSAKSKLMLELKKVSQLDPKSKSAALQQLRDVQLQIGNDDHDSGSLTEDCPPDFQEQGVRVSLIKIDMIQNVVDRVQELISGGK